MPTHENHLPESGVTEVSPGLARCLVATCLLALLAVPTARHLAGGGPTAAPFAAFSGALGELAEEDGWRRANRRLERRMDELEGALEEGSVLMESTLPAVQWLMAGWGGAGNEETYVGWQGWLFHRPGLDALTGPPFLDERVLERHRDAAPSWRAATRPDPRPAILDLHRQLRERGIRLLLLPVPTKATLHPDGLAPGERPAPARLHNPSYDRLLAELTGAGVAVLDPTETLARFRHGCACDAYLRTDSHWSPGAVDAVAAALAAQIRERVPHLAEPAATWRRRPAGHRGRGDLARTLRLPAWGDLYPPEAIHTERVAAAAGRPWQPDPGAQILLLGDSFTNVYSDPGLGWGSAAGLAEQLAFHLRRGVDRIAVNNAGAQSSRRRLAQQLRADPERLSGKELLIWQFAARELAGGDWPLIELPRPPGPPAASPPFTPARERGETGGVCCGGAR